MRAQTLTHTASDGREIFVYHWSPPAGAAVRGVVHITHGMAEHAARYEPVAAALTARGFEVYAHDHRGHGRTARADDELGDFGPGGWARVIADVVELFGVSRAAHGDVPRVLLGHSMGSYMAQQLMYERGAELAAVVLSGTNGPPPPAAAAGKVIARLERLRLGRRGKSKVINAMAFGAFNKPFRPARTPFDWLSRDAAEVDRYVADPRCGFECGTELWIELLAALSTIVRPDNVRRVPRDLPVLVLTGAEDPVSEQTRGIHKLLELYRAAGLRAVTPRFYPQARHEIFNELNRAEVLADLCAWLDRALAAPRP